MNPAVLDTDTLSEVLKRRNPIVLREHNPGQVVGSAVAVGFDSNSNSVAARIRFAPVGSSDIADETRLLCKAGVLRGISAGIEPITVEPLDPKRGPFAGLRVLKAELLEISLCAIPADSNALITQRLGWAPGIALRDGMEKTYRWIHDEILSSQGAHGARAATATA